jgi:hypothetical protein
MWGRKHQIVVIAVLEMSILETSGNKARPTRDINIKLSSTHIYVYTPVYH